LPGNGTLCFRPDGDFSSREFVSVADQNVLDADTGAVGRNKGQGDWTAKNFRRDRFENALRRGNKILETDAPVAVRATAQRLEERIVQRPFG
jgi:hypothetical protein